MNFFHKYHQWVGLPLALFLIFFSISGIILNHRKALSEIDLPRKWLPKDFRYNNWNNAFVKGSLKITTDSILLFGGNGIWLTDSSQHHFSPFNQGLRKGADNRITNRIVQTDNNQIFAATTFDLYQLKESQWENLTEIAGIDERLCDISYYSDTLVVMTRSYLFISVSPFREFRKVTIKKPADYKAQTTLFRTLWLFHSGKLFGITGQIFVDILGLLLIVISITGIIFFFSPSTIKRRKRRGRSHSSAIKTMKTAINYHNKIGVIFLAFFIVITISGMFLRPPLMIAIILNKISNPKGTILDNKNPWHDKLRTIRYDQNEQDWLLYTSEGFYSLAHLEATPEIITITPPISVMGVTVLEPSKEGWIVGSFSGLFSWSRKHDFVLNCYTGQPIMGITQGRPVSTNPISGYSSDFEGSTVFEYGKGVITFDAQKEFASMPDSLTKGQISLYHAALEVHTGRAYAYLLGLSGDLYTFLSGLLILLLLISGYLIYRRKYRGKRKNVG